jgi:nifR3 family TIM-barrel protein
MSQQLKIGSLALANNLFLAPMAGVTNLPMRLLARECGASLCFTEMVSVNGLIRDGKKTFDYLRSTPADRPLGIQIFGEDAATLAQAARLVAPHGDLIDINMGCPVRKVVGSGAGSALLKEPAKVAAIIRAVRHATDLPLTIKIRSGWHQGEENFLTIARIAEDEGCDAITLHPRTRSQMFEGAADWDQIRALKEQVSLPVIGSGDLFLPGDVAAMLHRTGCDAVMIARGGLGNPWIFREALTLLTGCATVPPDPDERRRVALRHLELFIDFAGEGVAVREMRKHFAWYARGVAGAARFRREVNGYTTVAALRDAATAFFSAWEA